MVELIAVQILDESLVPIGDVTAAKVFIYRSRTYVRLHRKTSDSAQLITIIDVKSDNSIYKGDQPNANSIGIEVYYALRASENNG
jgi:hypothetical protein